MEKQALVIDALLVNFDRDRLSTVWARRLDPTIHLQGSTDANCVQAQLPTTSDPLPAHGRRSAPQRMGSPSDLAGDGSSTSSCSR